MNVQGESYLEVSFEGGTDHVDAELFADFDSGEQYIFADRHAGLLHLVQEPRIHRPKVFPLLETSEDG
jgi:hypothetical protein